MTDDLPRTWSAGSQCWCGGNAGPTPGFVDAGRHVKLDRRPSVTARPPISISRKSQAKSHICAETCLASGVCTYLKWATSEVDDRGSYISVHDDSRGATHCGERGELPIGRISAMNQTALIYLSSRRHWSLWYLPEIFIT